MNEDLTAFENEQENNKIYETAQVDRNQFDNPEVDEVLNRSPSWLVRWGIAYFFFVMMVIIGVAWFIKYPDIISSTLKIYPRNLPKNIVFKNSTGRLDQLFAEDGEKVSKNKIIAFFESTAKHDDVINFEKFIDSLILDTGDVQKIYSRKIPIYFTLGELQKPYQIFQDVFIKSNSVLTSGILNRKKKSIDDEIGQIANMKRSNKEQVELQEKDLKLSSDEAESLQRLSDKGLVSVQEAKNSLSKYYLKKQSLEQLKGSEVNFDITAIQKRQEFAETDKKIEELKMEVLQSIFLMKNEILLWKQKYLAIAPIDGYVHFSSVLEKNQLLNTGESILTISPKSEEYYGEIWLGQHNLGKVKKGQRVVVKMDSYPYQEYGTIEGRIDYIASMPRDSTTLLKVIFPLGLYTNYQNKVNFKYGMTAKAEIVTNETRLLKRIFRQLVGKVN